MKKTIIKVFGIIGALVLCLVIWGVFFNGGGVIASAWNAIVKPVNSTWANITGDANAKLLPTFSETGAGKTTGKLDAENNKGGL